MNVTHYRMSRNWLAWKEGVYTLKLEFRGTKKELRQKLIEELEKELENNA